jgi:hypothetical protein
VTTERPAPPSTASRQLGVPGRLLLVALLAVGAVAGTPSGFGLVWFVAYAGVGTLLAIRRPGTSIGWILLALGWSLVLASISIDATREAFAAGTVDPITAILAVLSSVAGAAGFFLFAVLAIVFPSGRLPAGPWRPIAKLAIGAGAAALMASAVMPIISVGLAGAPTSLPVRNPATVLPDLAVWQVVTPDTVVLPVVALMIGAVVALVARFHGASGIERQQLRWLTAALAFVVTAVVGGFAVGTLIPATASTGIPWLGAIVAFPCVPVAIGIAILRYRLYEIDRIVSRTISYTVVTALLVGVFAGAVLVFQTILAPLTGQDTIAVAASTLVVAALFQPLRVRVQRVVDRRFNRARYDAERTAAAFAGRLRDQVGLDAIERDVLGTVDAAVRPRGAALWISAADREAPG